MTERRTLTNPEHIVRAAQWLADRPSGDITPIIPTVKARFDLTDADAAEAAGLAGNYSICRRAFS